MVFKKIKSDPTNDFYSAIIVKHTASIYGR